MKVSVQELPWTIVKSFFFLMGVHWLISTVFDIYAGRQINEVGVLLTFAIAVLLAILEHLYRARSDRTE